MKRPQATVIIAFYNNFSYLSLVLAAFETQNFTDFEIIIADDGSNEPIVKRVNELIKKSQLFIRHAWQEDRGCFFKERVQHEKCRKINLYKV